MQEALKICPKVQKIRNLHSEKKQKGKSETLLQIQATQEKLFRALRIEVPGARQARREKFKRRLASLFSLGLSRKLPMILEKDQEHAKIHLSEE